MMLSKNWLKEQSVKLDKFCNNAGNGKKVPEYELNDDNEIVPKIDKETKKRCYHNLYKDIQDAFSLTDYKKLLKEDPTIFSRLPKQGTDLKNCKDGIDISEFGEFGDLVSAMQKINNKYGDDGFNKMLAHYQNLLQKKQQVNAEKSQDQQTKVENKESDKK